MAGKHGGTRKGAGRKSHFNRPRPRGQSCLSFAGPPVANARRTLPLTVDEARLQQEANEQAEQQLRAEQRRQHELAEIKQHKLQEERQRQRAQQDALNLRRLARYSE